MTRTRFAALATLVSLVWFLVLVLHHPNITYNDGRDSDAIETECESILGFGDSTVIGSNGGPRDATVVRGDDAVNALQLEAMDSESIEDERFIQRLLDADCTDRRATLQAWSTAPAIIFTLALVALGPALGRGIASVREMGPRAPANWRDLP
ncbi:hypothetical protein BJ980_002230 [Nocardioides daedukensis]|uniref:Uncharacterized protein n=1 Tax=Nocardioides daedukensis TaxID=634462 RepID=A0A7Y9UQI5_9ACTN|nr:hypothetical protein [Nocardioides daedukensis]NYG59307.1 hypothetical protein [Nocardioides daedukensis]